MSVPAEIVEEWRVKAVWRAARVEALAILTPSAEDPNVFDEDSSLCRDALKRARDVLDRALAERPGPVPARTGES